MTQSSRCGSSMARQLPTSSPSTSATRWTDGARSGSHEGMSVERLMRGVPALGAGTPRLRRWASRAAWTRRDRSVSAWRSVRRAAADRPLDARSRRPSPPPRSIISTSSRCRRRSAVSSGWKAVASTRPCRTATGAPSGRGPAPRPRADVGDERRADEDAVERLARRGPATSRSASKRVELAAVAVAAHLDVEQAEDRLVAVGDAVGEQDHAGAGARAAAPRRAPATAIGSRRP